MPKYVQIKLNEMISVLGEEKTKVFLDSYSCPGNKDVETFIKYKAIEFSKQYLARTTLVYWISEDGREKYWVGYYTIAPKYICVSRNSISNSMAKRMNAHGTYIPSEKKFIIPAPLIGQLGKNFDKGNDTLISGRELLQMAVDKVKEIQNEIGGRFVYLECEDNKSLIDFYRMNGFTVCGRRSKKGVDKNQADGYFVQLLRYLR